MNKANEKSCLIVNAYNDKKKNLVLIHLPKMPGVKQNISSCLAAIIQKDDNDSVRFFLWDNTQTYVEVVLDFNLNFYIRSISKLML